MPKVEETIRFTVSLPRPPLDELDRRLVARGYASRSELVRDLIRARMVEDAWAEGEEEVAGVLTIVYDHHQRDLSQQIVDVLGLRRTERTVRYHGHR
jgi:CopG family nickel-responsive transcriptional regulator